MIAIAARQALELIDRQEKLVGRIAPTSWSLGLVKSFTTLVRETLSLVGRGAGREMAHLGGVWVVAGLLKCIKRLAGTRGEVVMIR